MSPRQFRLEPNEMAMIMAHLGEAETALRLLLAQEPPPADDDAVRDRLLQASDALAARNLLSVELDGSLRLDGDLERLAQVSVAPEFTIGLSRSRAGVSTDESFHFRDGRIVSQRSDAGSAYVLTEEESLDAVVDAAVALFQAEAATDDEPLSLPANLLDDLSRATTVEEARAVLAPGGAAEAVLRLFAADYVLPALRGGLIRTHYGHGHPVSEAGALVIGGAERAWLLRLDGHNVGNLLLVAATRDSLRDEIVRLTRPRP
jgi:hypothetical protein